MASKASLKKWILKDYNEVQEKEKKMVILCSCPPLNMKIGIFTL